MDNTKRLFSKLSIVIFSAFGTTFFGALLYAQNLRETNKDKFIWPTVIFSLVVTYFNYKLSLLLHIPLYYIFIPLHLIGGLIIVGPFWKYQIGDIENFQKRKIWGPAAILIIPIALLIFLNIYLSPHKMTATEFQEATKIEAEKQMKNLLFVANDSATNFFDLELPLLSNSYTLRTTVEDVNSFYNYIDYEEGRFSVVCMRTPLADNEVFGLDLVRKTFPELISKNCNNPHFANMLCADISRTTNGNTIHGSVALIKVDKIIYQFITQFVELDKLSADSLSYYLIDKINQASSK
jgi:hypothetical protein